MKLSIVVLVATLFLTVSCGGDDGDPQVTVSANVFCSREDAVARLRPSIVRITSDLAEGTGTVVGRNEIATNYHVIAGAAEIVVELSDGTEVRGEFVGGDADRDIALVSADTADVEPVAVVSPGSLQPGSDVVSIGFALGLRGEPTVSEGIFSARRNVEGFDFLQTTASVNFGNSGGPLADKCGLVVGLITAKISEAEGIGLAVPIDDAEVVWVAAREGSKEPDSGDDEGGAPQDGDLESYFLALQDIVVTADREQEEIGGTLDREFATDVEYVEAAQDAFHQSGQLFESALLELAELDPPEEATQAHEDYFAHLEAALVLLSELSAEVDEATSGAEVEAAFEERGPGITDANGLSEDSCVVLQGIADDNEIAVDLECLT